VAAQGGMGLWHQLLDKTDSYLETSASAMFTFTIARGVNRGWLSP
jgi:rhamnogalacturonyl hydrolase YesR